MASTGEDGSCTCKTDPLHIVMCCLVFKIFSVRTHWQFFSTNENYMGYLLHYYGKQRPKLTSLESLKDHFLTYLIHYYIFLTLSCTWSQ